MEATFSRIADRFPLLSAFRSANYRLYWSGLLMAVMGFQVQMTALALLVYDRTASPLLLGAVPATQAVPTMLFSLFGGALADRVDRRRLLMATQFSSAAIGVSLALLSFSSLFAIWQVFLLTFFQGIVQAFDQPTRISLVPHIIKEKKDLMSAVSLNSAVWQSSRIIAPTLAAIIYVAVGPAFCFALTAVGYLAMLSTIFFLNLERKSGEQARGSLGREILEGLKYVKGNSIFSNLILVTFFNSLFGMSYVAIMPVFAKDILHVGQRGYGYIMTASGAGALAGTITMASLGGLKQKGKVILANSILFGLLVILFAHSTLFPLSMGLVAVAGFLNAIYLNANLTVLQLLVPDQLRGRVMGIYAVTWSLMPLGGLPAGALAGFIGAPWTVTIGGGAVAGLAVVLAAFSPRLRRLE